MMSLSALRPLLPRKVGALRGGPNGPSNTPAADAQMCWELSKVEQWQPRTVRSPGSRGEALDVSVCSGGVSVSACQGGVALSHRALGSRERECGRLTRPLRTRGQELRGPVRPSWNDARSNSCTAKKGRRSRIDALARTSLTLMDDHARRAWHVAAVCRDT